MMSRYQILLNVLDEIRHESHETKYEKLYIDQARLEDEEYVIGARSRAYIHLYLKVMYGLFDFTQREQFVTDGSRDGGIDGYYIDAEKKIIYLIQSKFRTREENFEFKVVNLEELAKMDLDRILKGEDLDLQGERYNGKIQGMVRNIRETEGVGRYKYKVIVIANFDSKLVQSLSKMLGNYDVELFDYKRCYSEILFPVLTSSFFKAGEISISIDLSNKNTGSKIGYFVETEHFDCDITVVFVPTYEIAKIMSKYKNSILMYNPRAYLDIAGQNVNEAIINTIVDTNSNEFALFNNGITLISDETNINEKFGRKNKAQLQLLNPQIINGGQTAYTLSQIFEKERGKEQIFLNKEVLVKIITLVSKENGEIDKFKSRELIEKISTATNRQTAVSIADRASNEEVHVRLQKELFDRYGLIYERKRGEFGDSLKKNYLSQNQIIERTSLIRIYFLSINDNASAVKRKVFNKLRLPEDLPDDPIALDRLASDYIAFARFRNQRQAYDVKRNRDALAKVYIRNICFGVPRKLEGFQAEVLSSSSMVANSWEEFLGFVRNKEDKTMLMNGTGGTTQVDLNKWVLSNTFIKDVEQFYIKSNHFKLQSVASLASAPQPQS